MMTIMALPQEVLLTSRRNGDYARYAALLAQVPDGADDAVRMRSLRRLSAVLDLDRHNSFNTLLSQIRRRPPRSEDEAAAVWELAHLRDLLQSLAAAPKNPGLGDLPPGGLAQVRAAAAAVYDLTLLDGVIAWIVAVPVNGESGEPHLEGKTSQWNKQMALRGYRLAEVRRQITGAATVVVEYEEGEDGSRHIWANKAGGHEAVLARIAEFAAWSPSRRVLQESPELRAVQGTRGHGFWVRQRLADHWVSIRETVMAHAREGRDETQIARDVRVRLSLVREWSARAWDRSS
jgi:hypothetical protein